MTKKHFELLAYALAETRPCADHEGWTTWSNTVESVRDALRALSDAGAFATQTGRAGLLGVIEEARDTEWCKREVLDEVERYATFAFVLDGTEVTCGVVGV